MNTRILIHPFALIFLGQLAVGCGLVRSDEVAPPPGSSGAAPVPVSPAAALPAVEVPLTGPTTCLHARADGTCIRPSPDDEDGDGFVKGQDCDDHDPHTYPGAPEGLCDGVDEDCNGSDLCPRDADHDGFSAPGDCDDNDPKRNPGAPE